MVRIISTPQQSTNWSGRTTCGNPRCGAVLEVDQYDLGLVKTGVTHASGRLDHPQDCEHKPIFEAAVRCPACKSVIILPAPLRGSIPPGLLDDLKRKSW